MIVVVSDVHLAEAPLGEDPKVRRDDQKFVEFLDYIAGDQLSNGGDLVLLGDIIEFWRRDFAKALMESDEVVSRLMSLSGVDIHYVVGNHDYYMLRLNKVLSTKFPFNTLGKTVQLSDGGKNFVFIHGYQLEVLSNPYYKSLTAYERFAEGLCLAGDDTGDAADKLWETIELSKSFLDGLRRLPTDISRALRSMMHGPNERLEGAHKARSTIDELSRSRARSIYLGMGKDDVLVFGHTHRPFDDSDSKEGVVNTGSWKKNPCKDYSYVEIEDGQAVLKTFS